MKKDILRLTIKAGIIFTFVTTCFAVTYYRNADLARELLQEYMTVLESVMEDDGSLSWFALYKNYLFSKNKFSLYIILTSKKARDIIY